MRKPDFFIVGAPKCGTTAIYDYLAQHPDVCLARKEVHFFGRDLNSTSHSLSEAEYISLFGAVKKELRLGEGSVWYFYSRLAPQEIRAFSPDARIIISVRNPADMIYSLHSQLVYNLAEDIENFESALRAEQDGRTLPLALGPRSFTYLEAGKYCSHVKRYLDTFGRENVHIVVFDDLKENPQGVYSEICEFLGVSDFEPKFRVVNPNKKNRSRFLQGTLQDPPLIVRKLGRTVMSESNRLRLTKALQGLNTRYVARPPMTESVRRELNAYFASDVDELSDLLGRDLAHWCQ